MIETPTRRQIWTPDRQIIRPRWRRPVDLLDTAGKLQRDPSTGKLQRNDSTGKVQKNTELITACCCAGKTVYYRQAFLCGIANTEDHWRREDLLSLPTPYFYSKDGECYEFTERSPRSTEPGTILTGETPIADCNDPICPEICCPDGFHVPLGALATLSGLLNPLTTGCEPDFPNPGWSSELSYNFNPNAAYLCSFVSCNKIFSGLTHIRTEINYRYTFSPAKIATTKTWNSNNTCSGSPSQITTSNVNFLDVIAVYVLAAGGGPKQGVRALMSGVFDGLTGPFTPHTGDPNDPWCEDVTRTIDNTHTIGFTSVDVGGTATVEQVP